MNPCARYQDQEFQFPMYELNSLESRNDLVGYVYDKTIPTSTHGEENSEERKASCWISDMS